MVLGQSGRAAVAEQPIALPPAQQKHYVASKSSPGKSSTALSSMPRSAQGPISAVVDPWIQQAELTASDGAYGNDFGDSVAISGNTAVIGAPQHPYSGPNAAQGAAYVFVQSGGAWVQQAELTASDGAAFDGFGASVAVSGSTIVVGAPPRTVGSNQYQGAVYVFVESGGTWSQQAELTASDGGSNNYFGFSVALSGSTITVGATGHSATGSNVAQGAAYVFVESGGTWTQQAELTASDGMAYDQLGSSVAVSGSTVVAGAPCHAVNYLCQGAAYVFVESGGTWSQQEELTASDGGGNDDFGWSVALSGSTMLMGATHHMVGSNITQGAAYVFVESGGTWSQQEELTSADGVANDFFGYSVALSGSTVLVGAPQHPYLSSLDVPGPGAAYVFVESGGTWGQQAEPTASDGAANEGFGHSVAVDGGTGVVGAPTHPAIGPNADQGAAYVFGSSSLTGTTTKLGLSPSTVVAGSSGPVVMTATVAPTSGGGTPTGTVTFYNASTQIGTGTLSGGVATYSYNPSSLAVGPYSITAGYSGDSTFFTSTSTPQSLTVTAAVGSTRTSLSLSPSTVVAGSSGPVVMTATVSPTSGSGNPTGTVTFYNSSTQIGTGTLNNGVTAYNYNPSSLAVGAYSMTATYGGDSNFSASSSSPQTLTVTSAPTFTVSVNPTSLTIKAGQSGQAVFTVTPENGFNSKVSFSCSGLPAESSCSFNPISVTPSNGQAATGTLTISTTAPSAAMRRAAISTRRPFYALLLFPGIMVALGRASRQRRASRGLQLLALLVLIAVFGNGVSSCGGGSGGSGGGNSGTPPGTSTVTVTASTGSTGVVTQTANLTVTVTQ